MKNFIVRFEVRHIASVRVRASSREEANEKAMDMYLDDGLSGKWKEGNPRIADLGSNQWTGKSAHCARGHKYTPENTIEKKCSKHKNGIKRQCRKCKAQAMRLRRKDLRRASAELREAAEGNYDDRSTGFPIVAGLI